METNKSKSLYDSLEDFNKSKTVDELIESELDSFPVEKSEFDLECAYRHIVLQAPNTLLTVLKSPINVPSKHDLMLIKCINDELTVRKYPKDKEIYNTILGIYKDRK